MCREGGDQTGEEEEEESVRSFIGEQENQELCLMLYRKLVETLENGWSTVI